MAVKLKAIISKSSKEEFATIFIGGTMSQMQKTDIADYMTKAGYRLLPDQTFPRAGQTIEVWEKIATIEDPK